jgi:hypothetical protein
MAVRRCSKFYRCQVLWLLFTCALGWCPLLAAAEIPADSRLSIRLTSLISSEHSQPGNVVSALLIAPVQVNGKQVLPSGFVVTGTVVDPSPAHKKLNHSVLCLNFGELVGKSDSTVAFRAKVLEVDNGREDVDGEGVIHGLRPLERRPTELEDVLMLAAAAHPALLGSVELGRFIVSEEEKPRVTFEPGVELWLALTSALQISSVPQPQIRREAATLGLSPELKAMLNKLPLRTATREGTPSDLINVAFLGTRDDVVNAFVDAGWLPAEKLDVKTEVRTFFAVAYQHSYREGPVSSLVVDGQPPAMVFEKETDTFSKRHHIRIWASSQSYNGLPVWIGAGTHDIGIDFSRKARTFSHSVDRYIDEERLKIVNDLIFSGDVRAWALVDRPAAPHSFQNGTGDNLQTDGDIAVMSFKP